MSTLIKKEIEWKRGKRKGRREEEEWGEGGKRTTGGGEREAVRNESKLGVIN